MDGCHGCDIVRVGSGDSSGGYPVWPLWLVPWGGPMATVKGGVKGGQGEQFEFVAGVIIDTWRMTWFCFEYSCTEVHTLLPTLCTTYFGAAIAMVIDVKVFTAIEKSYHFDCLFSSRQN